MIFKNTFPVIMFIILSEYLRYNINFRARDNKLLLFISFLAFVLITNTLTFNDLAKTGYSDAMVVVKQLGLFILPSITTNILLTFMSMKVGYKSNIIYRLLTEIPLYFLPIFPNFGDYLEAVLRLSLPIVFYIWLYRYLEKKKSKKELQKDIEVIEKEVEAGLKEDRHETTCWICGQDKGIREYHAEDYSEENTYQFEVPEECQLRVYARPVGGEQDPRVFYDYPGDYNAFAKQHPAGW